MDGVWNAVAAVVVGLDLGLEVVWNGGESDRLLLRERVVPSWCWMMWYCCWIFW